MDGLVVLAKIGKQNILNMRNEKIDFMWGETMTIEEAIKNIQEDGIDLSAGDYVDIEALKVAVETMKDYQRIIYENERLRHETKLATDELAQLHKLITEQVAFNTPTMNITITKEQADKLGFKFE